MNLLLDRVERIYNLIDGVLKYSKVGRIQEGQAQINLNKFLPEVIDMIAPPENIHVTIENELPNIMCEETHIMQLFQNLLSNAIKYMDKPEGWIKISCIEEGNFWKFSIADNGPGIEEKHFERIFRMFQVLSVNEEVEGTGVGLTVVKKIAELYGGKIWIESKVGQGSTFFFTLPKQDTGITNLQLQTNNA
jgi:signal transduction histidine kinase